MAEKDISLMSERFKERYTPVYEEALKRMDKLDKKFALALQVMDAVDAKVNDIPQQTKELVRYEMATRFGVEKHKVLDILYAPLSSVLDARSVIDGTTIKCPDCNGLGIVENCVQCGGTGRINDDICQTCKGRRGKRCDGCGGIGKIINHALSLEYKLLYTVGDLTRGIHMMLHGAPSGDSIPSEILEPAFEQMRLAGVKGEEAEEAIRAMIKTMGLGEENAEAFIHGYDEYCDKKGMPDSDDGGDEAEDQDEDGNVGEEDQGS